MSFCYRWFKDNWFSSDKCQTRVNYNYNFFILYFSPNDTKKTWLFNFCNDTQYYKQIKDENNKTKLDLFHDSQIVYKYGDEIIRLTGGFYKNKKNGKVIDINKKIIIKTELGDKIKANTNNYSTDIIFINNKTIQGKNYYIANYPDIHSPTTNMTIHVNFDNITKHLLIQRVLNNYYIITGIIFLIIGIILCFFGNYETLSIICVGLILGELISFIFFEIIIGINKKWFEFLYISIGILIDVVIFCCYLWEQKIYKYILSITAGIIFGIYLTDIFIFPKGYFFIFTSFVNTLLISSATFLIIVKVIKKHYIFLNSIIGGYIFVRGLSTLLSKFLKYRELQLILYFESRNEWDYFIYKKDDELNWSLFWIYDILIAVFIIISIIYYYLRKILYKNKLNSKFEEEIIEENKEYKDEFIDNET